MIDAIQKLYHLDGEGYRWPGYPQRCIFLPEWNTEALTRYTVIFLTCNKNENKGKMIIPTDSHYLKIKTNLIE